MSHFVIPILTDSTSESVGSSTSLVFLSDTKEEVMAIPVALPEITLEAEADIDGLLSLTAMLDHILNSDPEAEPSEAPLSPDHAPVFPIHEAPETVGPLPAQVVSTPPAQVTPAPPIVSSPPLQIVPTPSFLSPPSFVRPSRKRCRSPTSYLPAVIPAPTILPHVPADRPLPRKWFRGSPALLYQGDTIQTMAEPVTPPAHPHPTIEERLDEQKEARARAAEKRDMFSRERISYSERILAYAEYLIQESEVARVEDGLRIRRIE
ncbi:hypothetical protein Tco_1236136 [Tanacetum coccineum]